MTLEEDIFRLRESQNQLSEMQAQASVLQEKIRKDVQEGASTGNPRYDILIAAYDMIDEEKTNDIQRRMKIIEWEVVEHQGEPIVISSPFKVSGAWGKNEVGFIEGTVSYRLGEVGGSIIIPTGTHGYRRYGMGKNREDWQALPGDITLPLDPLVKDNLRLVGFEYAPIVDEQAQHEILLQAGLADGPSPPASTVQYHPDQLVFQPTSPDGHFDGVTVAIGHQAVESFYAHTLEQRVQVWEQRRRGEINAEAFRQTLQRGKLSRLYEYRNALTVLGKTVPQYLQPDELPL